MKRSPASSCSSSSSNFAEKPTKTKRSRKINNQTRKQNAKSSKSSSARRSSIYRGVTRHRWTGRFEAHLWDKSTWNNIQNKKGRQVYLGAYDSEEAAAHTYDLAALKYWGPDTTLNFPVDKYTKELEEMQKVTREEYLATLRRRSSGFSRGVSKYRGVARHHHNGRWEARIGRVFGNKYLYLGTYDTQEEAAAAYDLAAIEYRGANAMTNFDISNYNIHHLNNQILPSSTQPQQQQKQEEEEEEEEASTQLQYSPGQLLSCMDSTTMAGVNAMQPSKTDDHKLNWSFLGTSGFSQLSVPDLVLDKHLELPDLSFNDTADFEDSIDFMFGETVSSDRNDIIWSAVLDDDADATTTDFKVIDEVKASGKVNDSGGQQRQLSSSSSPTSTTTSISCNLTF